VIVGDRRLPRIDRPARDLVEGMDGEGRGAVGRRQEIGIYAKRVARLQRTLFLVHAMRPDDLFGGGQLTSDRFVGKLDSRYTFDRGTEFAASRGNDAAGSSQLVLFWRERLRLVGLALREVRNLS
jgi:hypothetical protein